MSNRKIAKEKRILPATKVEGENSNGFEEEDKGTVGNIDIDLPFAPKDIRIRTVQPTISNLISRIKNEEIDLAPDYQRKSGLWKPREKSRLIESLLARIPLPAFYVDATNEERWIIIDGLQRITTLKEYIVDEWDATTNQRFGLQDLEFFQDCEGKTFSELDRMYQRRIEETQITLSQIEKGTNDAVKYTIFNRINTGGLPLSPQEIRHALNQGYVTKFLKKLAEDTRFSEPSYGWNNLHAERMEDRECILRFLVFFRYNVDSYPDGEPSLDLFLNKGMKKLNEEPEKTYKNLEKKFFAALELAGKLFGENAFRRPRGIRIYPFNKAIFEAWMVALASLSKKQQDILIARKDDLVGRYRKLMECDTAVSVAFTSGTGQLGRVRTRFDAIRNLVQEVMQ